MTSLVVSLVLLASRWGGVAGAQNQRLVFDGGDIGDLTRTLAQWSGRPTVGLVQAKRARPAGRGITQSEIDGYRKTFGVILKSPGPEWYSQPSIKPFEIGLSEVGDGKDLVRLLGVKAHLESYAKEKGLALWDKAWQTSTTFVEGGGIPLPDGWSSEKLEDKLISDGLATIDLPKKHAVQVDDVAKLSWPKPVKVHWLLKQMWIVPSVKRAGERETLSAIAAAVSGRLVETDDEFRIDLDSQRFRPRAQASIEQQREETLGSLPKDMPRVEIDVSVAGFDLSQQVWQQIDDGAIQELFHKPNFAMTRPARRETTVFFAITRYISAFEAWVEHPPTGRERRADVMRGQLNRIDWKGEPILLIGQNFGVSPGCPAKGGGTVLL